MVECGSVLYVDDDPDICNVVQAALCLIAGLDVFTASSGLRAIDLAYELRPDLILMDVMMPGLDGPATLRIMRQSALIDRIPVIFLTAKVLPAEVAHLLQLGAIGVIGKPFDALTLGTTVLGRWRDVQGSHAEVREVLRAPPDLNAPREDSQLVDLFRRRVDADIVLLRGMIERGRRGDATVFGAIERLAHSLHGSGAMFGFTAVSLTGAALERTLARRLAAPVQAWCDADPDLLRAVESLVNRLSEEAARAGSGSDDGRSPDWNGQPGVVTPGVGVATGNSR